MTAIANGTTPGLNGGARSRSSSTPGITVRAARSPGLNRHVQLDRKVTLPARRSPDHLKHGLGHHVEDKQGPGQPRGDSRDQPVHLLALEVRKQALGGDEDRVRRIQPVQPFQLECRSAVTRLSRAVPQYSMAKLHGLGQVHTHPPHLTVIHPPELRLQSLAQRNHGSGGMQAKEMADRMIECGDPDRM